jgi:hypothetical protein
MNKTCICFLDTNTFDGGEAIRGAALLTDPLTEPIEFRCTSEVKPTKLQRTLWGDRLTGHVATHLIGKPLLDALGVAPALILVRKPEFVELRLLIDLPLVQLLRKEELAKASPFAFPEGEREPLANGDQDESLVIKCHRQFQGDIEAACHLLNGECRSVSLLEPFSRIENSLSIVHQQDVGKTRS